MLYRAILLDKEMKTHAAIPKDRVVYLLGYVGKKSIRWIQYIIYHNTQQSEMEQSSILCLDIYTRKEGRIRQISPPKPFLGVLPCQD